MKSWSKNSNECVNCTTVRFAHKAKGYCHRCYQLNRKITSAQNWNLDRPQSLVGFFTDTNFWKQDILEREKVKRIRSLKLHLSSLKGAEESLLRQAYGLDLEYAFSRLAKRCGIKHKNLFHGQATFFDHSFEPEQKNILYKILHDIEERLPWIDGSRFLPEI